MLKKILLGTAILVTTSFATYNFFPVPQAHSGEVQIVSDFTIKTRGKTWISQPRDGSFLYKIWKFGSNCHSDQ